MLSYAQARIFLRQVDYLSDHDRTALFSLLFQSPKITGHKQTQLFSIFHPLNDAMYRFILKDPKAYSSYLNVIHNPLLSEPYFHRSYDPKALLPELTRLNQLTEEEWLNTLPVWGPAIIDRGYHEKVVADKIWRVILEGLVQYKAVLTPLVNDRAFEAFLSFSCQEGVLDQVNFEQLMHTYKYEPKDLLVAELAGVNSVLHKKRLKAAFQQNGKSSQKIEAAKILARRGYPEAQLWLNQQAFTDKQYILYFSGDEAVKWNEVSYLWDNPFASTFISSGFHSLSNRRRSGD